MSEHYTQFFEPRPCVPWLVVGGAATWFAVCLWKKKQFWTPLMLIAVGALGNLLGWSTDFALPILLGAMLAGFVGSAVIAKPGKERNIAWATVIIGGAFSGWICAYDLKNKWMPLELTLTANTLERLNRGVNTIITKQGLWATELDYSHKRGKEWVFRSRGPNQIQIRFWGDEEFVDDWKHVISGSELAMRICKWAGNTPIRKSVDQGP